MIRAQVGALRCDPVQDLINFRNGLLPWRSRWQTCTACPVRTTRMCSPPCSWR